MLKVIPLDQALALMKVEAKILALRMEWVKAYQGEAFGVKGVVNEDVEAGAYELEVVAVAYLEVPLT